MNLNLKNIILQSLYKIKIYYLDCYRLLLSRFKLDTGNKSNLEIFQSKTLRTITNASWKEKILKFIQFKKYSPIQN